MTDDWSNEAVESTLRVLSQAGIGVTAEVVAANLDVHAEDTPSEERVREALDELETREMVRSLDEHENHYRLTDRGRDYVREEFGEDAFGYVD